MRFSFIRLVPRIIVQLQIPVATNDIVNNAEFWLTIARSQQNVLPVRYKFEIGYRLSAAQYIVAMAMVINESANAQKIPPTIAVPAVRSPQIWEDKRNPISIVPPKPPEPDVQLTVAVNGIELPKGDAPLPAALSQPFCGPIHLSVTSSGPITKIVIAIDGKPLTTFSKTGTNGFKIDSLRLSDESHMLSVTATDAKGKTYPLVLSLQVKNGRASKFTPAITTNPDSPLIFEAD